MKYYIGENGKIVVNPRKVGDLVEIESPVYNGKPLAHHDRVGELTRDDKGRLYARYNDDLSPNEDESEKAVAQKKAVETSNATADVLMKKYPLGDLLEAVILEDATKLVEIRDTVSKLKQIKEATIKGTTDLKKVNWKEKDEEPVKVINTQSDMNKKAIMRLTEDVEELKENSGGGGSPLDIYSDTLYLSASSSATKFITRGLTSVRTIIITAVGAAGIEQTMTIPMHVLKENDWKTYCIYGRDMVDDTYEYVMFHFTFKIRKITGALGVEILPTRSGQIAGTNVADRSRSEEYKLTAIDFLL